MDGQTWGVKQVDPRIHTFPCFVVTLGTLKELPVHIPGQVTIHISIRGSDTSNSRGVENDINAKFDLESLYQY